WSSKFIKSQQDLLIEATTLKAGTIPNSIALDLFKIGLATCSFLSGVGVDAADENLADCDNKELNLAEAKQVEADDQDIQTILMGLTEDIYAAVDSCNSANEICDQCQIRFYAKWFAAFRVTYLFCEASLSMLDTFRWFFELQVCTSPHPISQMANFATKHSIMTQEMADSFCNSFYILAEVHPTAPERGKTISEFPAGKVGVYTRIFGVCGYRIPFTKVFMAVLKYFRVHISQLSPFGAVCPYDV
ncbi:hypothetical protein Tco_0783859, partial [Tanacetum coccineum]